MEGGDFVTIFWFMVTISIMEICTVSNSGSNKQLKPVATLASANKEINQGGNSNCQISPNINNLDNEMGTLPANGLFHTTNGNLTC